jgi:ABC-type molybdate transport system substrate-binding protein
MPMNSTQTTRHHLRTLIAIGGAGLFLASCASTPPAPTAALEAAHLAISNAERADAGKYAAAQLEEARYSLASANTAVAGNRMIVAEELANESRTEAELASATTAQNKAQAVNAQMQRSNGTLNEELQRNAGDQP